MFAIIKTGGKQYRVQKNDKFEVATIDAKDGESIELGEVLMLSDGKKATLGDALKGAKVMATVIKQMRGEKIIVFKKKRRQNYRRKNGHRQDLTLVQITDIKAA